MMTGSSDLAMERTLAGDVLEDRSGDVDTAFDFTNREGGLILHHRGEIVEGEVKTGGRVIEAATRVLLDQDRGDRKAHGRIAGSRSRRPPGGYRLQTRRFLPP